jgi:hypothetical protein
VERTGAVVTEPFVIVDGHAPWCAYIKSLDYWDNEQEPCDCAGWDDPDYDDGQEWGVDYDDGSLAYEGY